VRCLTGREVSGIRKKDRQTQTDREKRQDRQREKTRQTERKDKTDKQTDRQIASDERNIIWVGDRYGMMQGIAGLKTMLSFEYQPILA
jgi:hypothetical protein